MHAEKFPDQAQSVQSKDYYWHVSPSSLYNAIVRKLVEAYGFTHNEYKANFHITGLNWGEDNFESSSDIEGTLKNSGFTLVEHEKYAGIPNWMKNEDITN